MLGEIWLDDQNLLGLDDSELRQNRWTKLALIPQGAMNSLNLMMKISTQIKDVIQTHEECQPDQALKKCVLELCLMVGLPGCIYDMYLHELSGGDEANDNGTVLRRCHAPCTAQVS